MTRIITDQGISKSLPNFFHLFPSSKKRYTVLQIITLKKRVRTRREIFIDPIAKDDDEQRRVFLDRRAFSYSADDLHGNKLTPWRSARKKK